ncbi:hypothetical protein ACIQOF_36930 [Streptomyces sp. NPDC091265]|uniref:hypothetical protein n=1 Tax=unclassified Streptomyces TaxID=2593676 RepID=UPI00344E7B91
MTARTTLRSRSAVIATGFAALALFTSACSGGTDSGGTEKSTAGSGNSQADSGKADDAAVKERKCLREHGLKVPEPKPGEDSRGLTIGGDMNKDEMEKALKACAGKGGVGGGGGKITQADKDMMLKHARCMRENGYNMPDPKFDGSMAQAMPMPQGAEKKKFEAASKACEGILG